MTGGRCRVEPELKRKFSLLGNHGKRVFGSHTSWMRDAALALMSVGCSRPTPDPHRWVSGRQLWCAWTA